MLPFRSDDLPRAGQNEHPSQVSRYVVMSGVCPRD